jgi:hypothetical protein
MHIACFVSHIQTKNQKYRAEQTEAERRAKDAEIEAEMSRQYAIRCAGFYHSVYFLH